MFSAEGLDIYGADIASIMQKAKDDITLDDETKTIPYPKNMRIIFRKTGQRLLVV